MDIKRVVWDCGCSIMPWCTDMVGDLIHWPVTASEREEKNIRDVPRDPIPIDDFLRVLKHRRKKGTVGYEFKVGLL